MKIRLKLFSVAKDLAGFSEETIDLKSPAKAEEVFEFLLNRESRFGPWRNAVRLAVNQEYVHNDHPLAEGDEVAVIPPVSGG